MNYILFIQIGILEDLKKVALLGAIVKWSKLGPDLISC